jgi:anti-sigma factor RsiW
VTDEAVHEDLLHAYVDGALTPEEVARVDAWLATHPEDAATVAAWRHQNALIREVFGTVPERPDEAGPHSVAAARAPDRMSARLALAASIAAFAIGLGAGFGLAMFAPGMRPEAGAIAQEAATAYRVFSVEKRHPVEVGPDEREHLVKWLSNRLETPLAIPDLDDEGLSLVGGRLTSNDRGPAALFMFEAADGDRYTVYVTRPARAEETGFRFDLAGDVGACYWLDRQVAVVVNGPADRERLQAIANRVYEAYENAAADQARGS